MMPTTTTTRSTTVYRNRNRVKTEAKASDEVAIEKEVDPVLVHPVVAEAAYPNLVSIHKTTNKLAKLHIIKFQSFQLNIKMTRTTLQAEFKLNQKQIESKQIESKQIKLKQIA